MAQHSVGTLATRLFGLGCGFIYAVAVARLLGPSGYGLVAVATSTATVVATLSLLGANELGVRAVAGFSARHAWKDLRRFVAWSTKAVAAASMIAALIMAGASFRTGPYSNVLLLGSLAVPLIAALQLLRGLIQGTGRVVAAQVPLDAVRWIVTLLLIGGLALARTMLSPPSIVLVVVIALTVAFAASTAIFRAFLNSLPTNGSLSNGREHWLIQSLPFLTIALFGIIGTEIGTLLLGWLSGPRETGLYQPIAKLAPFMLIANDAIEAALAPRIVHAWEERDLASLQRVVSRSAFASVLSTVVVVVSILIASPYILSAFGPQFTVYQRLLIWIAAVHVLNAATGAAPLLLAMTGDMKSRIGAQAVTMIVQTGLGALLIPRFGARGAVAALVTSVLVWSLLHWWLALRATGIDTSPMGAFTWRRSRH